MTTRRFLSLPVLALFTALTCVSTSLGAEQWISLFNGKDLTGWTPKIRGYDLGENYANTFRVEHGLLCVNYDGYQKFDNRFGHLFYKTPYSNKRAIPCFMAAISRSNPKAIRCNSGRWRFAPWLTERHRPGSGKGHLTFGNNDA